jgi:hypothetical protein
MLIRIRAIKTCPTGLQHSELGYAGDALQSIIVVGPGIVGARSADGRARGPDAQAGDVLLRVGELG